MRTYYNEFDKNAAAWLRELMRAGLIPGGEVDVRSIVEVRADDLRGYDTCHFFAGIGGWPYALDLAGWNGPVWTGSCPCQPFSAAGKRRGVADERHLWPEFHRLIAERRPPVVFGEQVASKDGRLWLAGVRSDLEALGYGVGAADLCAAGVSAPHIRQRLYWMGVANSNGCSPRHQTPSAVGYRRPLDAASRADPGMADGDYLHENWWSGPLQDGRNAISGEVSRSGRQYRAQWRLKPGLSIVAYGVPGRVEQIRGYGNAIVPQVAAEFVSAYMDTLA